MLDMSMEFRKGILFVRLKGRMDKENCQLIKQELVNLITINGIRYVLLNLSDVTYIDKYGIKLIMDNYHYVNKNSGKLMLCGMNKVCNYDLNLMDNLYQINDELKAFNLVSL